MAENFGDGVVFFAAFQPGSFGTVFQSTDDTVQKFRKQGRAILQQLMGDVIFPGSGNAAGCKGYLHNGVNEFSVFGQCFPGNGKALGCQVFPQLRDFGLALHYIECHDNYTLFDKLAISKWQDINEKAITVTTTGNLFTKIGEEGLNAVKAQDKLAAAYVFLSQGTTFMNGGQEFLRTKRGNENSYNTSNGATKSTNGIDLNFAVTYSDVYNTYKGLIALRKANPEAFGANKDATAETVSKGVTRYVTGNFLVYFNASDAAVPVTTTGYDYEVDISSGNVVENAISSASVPAKSFVIFKK